MKIIKNHSLKEYNTFGIDVKAKEFAFINKDADLEFLYKQNKLNNILPIGGGSNMLLRSDLDKFVLKLNLLGKDVVEENENDVLVRARASEDWPEFVRWTLKNAYFGLENLTDIPGNVGTSPIQNIGAYGVELKDSFYKLKAFNISDGSTKEFTKEECKFGYRESIFKSSEKGKWIITDVYFKLAKTANLKMDYGAIKASLAEKGIENPSAIDVSDCISEIRAAKLPDPEEIGNSGSFFKNPVISIEHFRLIEKEYSDVPSYKISDNLIKVPAGWLIEKSGWKGFREGDAGVHEKQALVLVNYSDASGDEIYDLAQKILKDIKEKFNINLEIEVNIIS